MTSFFLIVDGPSASGKDSIIKELIKELKLLGKTVFSFEETKVLTYDRQKILAAKLLGEKAVAKAILEEREKLYQTIFPEQHADIIIANRGEPSMLAYQTLEQLSMESIWGMHRAAGIPLPDFVVITTCSPQEAERREALRGSTEEKSEKQLSGKFTLSLENSLEKRTKIHDRYKKVATFLRRKNIPLLYIDTDTMNVSEESQKIIDAIKKLL